jgi:hypothetical protein
MQWKSSIVATLRESRKCWLYLKKHARANDEIARQVYRLRTEARLTHGQLAKLVSTTSAVIRQLEEADYEGHALAMLNRIAMALNKRVEIRCLPIKGKLQAA